MSNKCSTSSQNNRERKWGLVHELIVTLFSGLVGVVMTLGYQYYFVKPQTQSFTLVYNGEKIVVTEADYVSQEKQNELLQNKIIDLQNEIRNLENENDILNTHNNELKDELNQSNDQIEQLSNEIEQLNKEIVQLNDIIDNFPSIEFRDISLSINGTKASIDSSDSSVVINEKTYYVDDFINNIISPNTMSIEDNTMYIDKNIDNDNSDDSSNNTINGKVSLLDQWVVNQNNVKLRQSEVDSYGNAHSNCLYFYRGGYIVYNLNEEYSLLKFKISVSEDAFQNVKNTLTIKADDTVVYTSPKLSRTTKPFDEIDIVINNCSLLRIESDYVGGGYCILSDVEVYN